MYIASHACVENVAGVLVDNKQKKMIKYRQWYDARGDKYGGLHHKTYHVNAASYGQQACGES
jgi:hypothetical protein